MLYYNVICYYNAFCESAVIKLVSPDELLSDGWFLLIPQWGNLTATLTQQQFLKETLDNKENTKNQYK